MLPLFDTGDLRPVIDSRYPLEQIADAHRAMERNANVGKILIDVAPGSSALTVLLAPMLLGLVGPDGSPRADVVGGGLGQPFVKTSRNSSTPLSSVDAGPKLGLGMP